MKSTIQDEFSLLPISRQRKYQLRRLRDGRCTQCGAPVIAGKRCLKHLIEARERQRKLQGNKRRYYNTVSYKLESIAPRKSSATLGKVGKSKGKG
jgi:hypothetical protein